MDRQPEHLREMTHRRLAAVVLPVRIGDEAHRRIEREIGRNRVEALRIERQHILQPLQRVKRQETDDAKSEHGHRIDEPALLARRIDAGEFVEDALDRCENRRQKRAFASEHARDIGAERKCRREYRRENKGDLRPTNGCHDVTSRNPSRRLELFGMKERVNEIDAEQDGDAKTDDGFIHGAFLSKTTAGARIGAHHDKEKDAETEINEIGHDPLLLYDCRSDIGPIGIKVLFGIWGLAYKDSIKTGVISSQTARRST